MTKIITIGNQKGGVGKTTTTAILAWLLSRHLRVLAVDMDMQTNLTQMISIHDSSVFEHANVLHAIESQNAAHYIYDTKIDGHHLHLLPAVEDLALFRTDNYYLLKNTLEPVLCDYDYILIDTPPSLGDHLLTSLIASTHVIGMMQSQPFSLDAMGRFISKVEQVKQINTHLELIGIVVAMFETDNYSQEVFEAAKTIFKDLIFDSTIYKRIRLRRMSSEGISILGLSDRNALRQYILLEKELIGRVR
jgi:chromosome partitioning protein